MKKLKLNEVTIDTFVTQLNDHDNITVAGGGPTGASVYYHSLNCYTVNCYTYATCYGCAYRTSPYPECPLVISISDRDC